MKRISIFACILTAFISAHSAAQAGQEASAPSLPTAASPQQLIPVKGSNGKWGYQNESGVFIVPPQYDRTERFSEGLAAVALKKKFGYVDSTGHVVIPLQFVHVEPFSEGLALVYTTWGMNILGAEEGYNFFVRAGYIDRDGNFMIKPRYVENAHSFSQGLAAFQAGTNYGNGRAKWGYLDRTGKWAIKPQFDIEGDFSEGLAPVAVVLDKKSSRQKWGYIDQAGKLQIPARFDQARPFSDGVARVFVGEKDAKFEHMHRPKWQFLGCINKAGEVVKRPTKPTHP